LALDRDTREIVEVAIGARDEATARQLWESLPAVCRQCAVCSSDFWDAYACVLPSNRHRPVFKDSGQTSRIERLNNTLRQRISRRHMFAASQSCSIIRITTHTAPDSTRSGITNAYLMREWMRE
jgi:IS1 family transposase